jgi:hypothetical protein
MAKISTGVRQALLGSVGLHDLFAYGTILFYSGAQPTLADDAVSGVLIAQATVDGGSFSPGSSTHGLTFNAPVAGVITKATAEIWKVKGIASGLIGYFRLVGNAEDLGLSSAVLPRIDGSCGQGTGYDISLSTLSPYVGSLETFDNFTITIG